MNENRSKRDATQNGILAAAEQLFLSQGYNGTSMRDIAEAAGYRSVAGLYNHFPDKEALFTALLQDRNPYDEIFATVQQVAGQTAAELFPNLFQFAVQVVGRNLNFVRLVMIDYLEFGGQHIQAILGSFQEQILLVIGRLHQLPDLRAEIPPQALIRLFGMSLFGYVMTSRLMPPPILNTLTEEQWQQQIIHILLHGISEEK
jgi:AcrR family transcriptional regulator